MLRKLRITPVLVLLAALLVSLGSATSASAAAGAVWYVAPDGKDTNSCALASEPCATPTGAIAKAAPGDMIRIAIGRYTGTGDRVVFVDKSLTLEGGWNSAFTMREGLSTIDGENVRKGVVVNTGVTVGMSRFAIENGDASFGPINGGGIANYGTTTVDTSVVRSNHGGGIVNYGDLTLTNSTVSGNTSNLSTTGGGVTSSWQGNPITTITNSTISGNSAGEGGGIRMGMPITGTAKVFLNNVTVTDNDAGGGGGGGVLVEWNTTLSMQNTIVAKNTSYFGGGQDVDRRGGSLVSQGYNILNVGGFGSWTPGPGDMQFVDPRLGPLEMKGGLTETHALRAGSPAIDAGNPDGCSNGAGDLLTTDQRGLARPFGARCDIGAFELDSFVDVTPPSITVQISFAVDATSPTGAIVTYEATATDDVDGPVPVTCSPPSGSLFPIGDTTVGCTASDAAGNTAEASFDVHVKGAVEQMNDLVDVVATLGPLASGLNFMLNRALGALKAGQLVRACSELKTFERMVYELARPPRPRLTAAQAYELASAGRRVRAVLACGY